MMALSKQQVLEKLKDNGIELSGKIDWPKKGYQMLISLPLYQAAILGLSKTEAIVVVGMGSGRYTIAKMDFPIKSNPADKQVTKVIFRRFKDGNKEVIALFPDMNYKSGDANYGHIMSYMHIGQHGEVDSSISRWTKPASMKEPDVKALFNELTSIGYNLKVVKRMSR